MVCIMHNAFVYVHIHVLEDVYVQVNLLNVPMVCIIHNAFVHVYVHIHVVEEVVTCTCKLL